QPARFLGLGRRPLRALQTVGGMATRRCTADPTVELPRTRLVCEGVARARRARGVGLARRARATAPTPRDHARGGPRRTYRVAPRRLACGNRTAGRPGRTALRAVPGGRRAPAHRSPAPSRARNGSRGAQPAAPRNSLDRAGSTGGLVAPPPPSAGNPACGAG